MAEKPALITGGEAVAVESPEPHSYPVPGLGDTPAGSFHPSLSKVMAADLQRQAKLGTRKKSPGSDYFIG